LKDHLSQELQEVRQGETLLVTDRHVVIAEIRQPTSAHARKVTRWEKWLTAQERAGQLRRATTDAPSWHVIAQLPRSTHPVDLQKLLDETRADRS